MPEWDEGRRELTRSAESHETLSIPGPEPKLRAMDLEVAGRPGEPRIPRPPGCPAASAGPGGDPRNPPMANGPVTGVTGPSARYGPALAWLSGCPGSPARAGSG